MLREVPGKLTIDGAKALYGWAYGRKVLQIGGFCGKGTAVLLASAERVWLLETFVGYSGSVNTVAGEMQATVLAMNGNEKVKLLFHASPNDLPEVPPADMVYVDADRPEDLADEDLDWALRAMPPGTRVVYHRNGDIKQQTL